MWRGGALGGGSGTMGLGVWESAWECFQPRTARKARTRCWGLGLWRSPAVPAGKSYQSSGMASGSGSGSGMFLLPVLAEGLGF